MQKETNLTLRLAYIGVPLTGRIRLLATLVAALAAAALVISVDCVVRTALFGILSDKTAGDANAFGQTSAFLVYSRNEGKAGHDGSADDEKDGLDVHAC